MYTLTQKVSSKKKVILATWTGGDNTCIRLAEVVFSHHGFNVNDIGVKVEWSSSLENQKMEKVFSVAFVALSDSEEQAEVYFDKQLIQGYFRMGKTKEYILDLYPEYSKYFKE